MNAILIHNDNIRETTLSLFSTNYKFDITPSEVVQTDFSFDKKAHDFLDKHVKDQVFDVIYIHMHLSNSNFLEFGGLRLAHHIRLTESFNHSTTPIVFIGNESIEEINLLHDFGSILFTPGIFTVQDDSDEILNQYQWIIDNFRSDNQNKLTAQNHSEYLKKIEITPPGHYDSKHSVDNELSLLRWSQYIGLELNNVKDNIESSLYFKYVTTLNPIPKRIQGEQEQISKSGKILLIDDQWENGWYDFYKSMLFSAPVELNVLYIRKGQKKEQIIKNAEQEIIKINPDVILLDLRLHDDDFKDKTQIADTTGIKVLQKIQKFNPGIRVIITTASSKAETYELTRNLSSGYIQKTLDRNVSQSISKLCKTIQTSLQNAEKLKTYHKYLEKIKTRILTNDFTKPFIELAKTNIDTTWILIKDSLNEGNKSFTSFAYLQLFYFLEEFAKENSVYIIDSDNNHYVIQGSLKYLIAQSNNGKKYTRAFKKRTAFEHEKGRSDYNLKSNYYTLSEKIAAILLFRYGLNNTKEIKWNSESWSNALNWIDINKKRNEIAHGEIIDEKYLKSLIAFILFLVQPKNQCKKQKQDLTKNSLSDLANKFNQK